jgi:hypothetical protein
MACTGQTLPPSYKKASIFEDKWLPCHFIFGRSRGLFQGEARDTENFRDFQAFRDMFKKYTTTGQYGFLSRLFCLIIQDQFIIRRNLTDKVQKVSLCEPIV